jgi:hypothetical protein
MVSNIAKLCTVIVVSLLASGCFVRIEVGPGGHVESKSGNYYCAENDVCMVTIADYVFFEEFIAVPNDAYFFRGWKHGISEATNWYRLCPAQYGPCNLGAGEYSDNALAQAIVDDEAIWVLEPDFVVDTPEDLFDSWLGEWRAGCLGEAARLTVAPCTEAWCPAQFIVSFEPADESQADILFALLWQHDGPYSAYFNWSVDQGQDIYSELTQVGGETIPLRGSFSKTHLDFATGTPDWYLEIPCSVSR